MKNLPEKSIMEIAIEVCVPHDIDVERLRFSKTLMQEETWARTKIAIAAKSAGWGSKAIGRFLNRDHSTVIAMLKSTKFVKAAA